MILIRKIKPDKYLKEFISYCKEEYKENLIGIALYGSYVGGYFDKIKSDYDTFLIFQDNPSKTKKEAQKEIKNKFSKVSLQYFSSINEIIDLTKKGHWSIYITLLTNAKTIYKTKGYKKFLKKLKKIDFLEELLDSIAMEYKATFEIEQLKKLRGYNAAKWALPSIRKRLQLLTYIKKKKAIWDLKKVLKINKELLTQEEFKFVLNLNKRVKGRMKDFNKKDKERSIKILEKLNHQIIKKELSKIIKIK